VGFAVMCVVVVVDCMVCTCYCGECEYVGDVGVREGEYVVVVVVVVVDDVVGVDSGVDVDVGYPADVKGVGRSGFQDPLCRTSPSMFVLWFLVALVLGFPRRGLPVSIAVPWAPS
jgi:preprotein translocase subunit SecG